MSYIPKNWNDLPLEDTPITADDLDHIENGISDVDTRLTTVETDIDGLDTRLTTVEEEIDDGDVYSTEEKAIGKWIDGKPLYRKVISIPKSSLTSGGTAEIANNITDLEMYVSITGFIRRTDVLGTSFPNIDPSADWTCFSPFLKATSIAITTGSIIYENINSIVVIILYTKTTD